MMIIVFREANMAFVYVGLGQLSEISNCLLIVW